MIWYSKMISRKLVFFELQLRKLQDMKYVRKNTTKEFQIETLLFDLDYSNKYSWALESLIFTGLIFLTSGHFWRSFLCPRFLKLATTYTYLQRNRPWYQTCFYYMTSPHHASPLIGLKKKKKHRANTWGINLETDLSQSHFLP